MRLTLKFSFLLMLFPALAKAFLVEQGLLSSPGKESITVPAGHFILAIAKSKPVPPTINLEADTGLYVYNGSKWRSGDIFKADAGAKSAVYRHIYAPSEPVRWVFVDEGRTLAIPKNHNGVVENLIYYQLYHKESNVMALIEAKINERFSKVVELQDDTNKKWLSEFLLAPAVDKLKSQVEADVTESLKATLTGEIGTLKQELAETRRQLKELNAVVEKLKQ